MNAEKEALRAIVREIAELKARLAKLEEAKRVLEPLVSGKPIDLPNVDRAPYGALQEAILSLFQGGARLTNADVRDGLKRANWPYKANAFHIRKTLSRMHETKLLGAQRENGKVLYLLPNPKK